MTVYNDRISQYIQDLFVHQDESLEYILEDSRQKGLPTINVKPEEGRFLQFLVRAANAKKVVEVGTLGGYSGTWIARGLPPGGRLITLEKDPRHAEISQEHIERAAVSGVVEIRVGDAHHLLDNLAAEGPVDFVFIDAEKTGYEDYFHWAMRNVREGGVIAIHNAFRKGSIVGDKADDEYSELMRAFNREVAGEENLISTIYPAGDGMIVAVKIT